MNRPIAVGTDISTFGDFFWPKGTCVEVYRRATPVILWMLLDDKYYNIIITIYLNFMCFRGIV